MGAVKVAGSGQKSKNISIAGTGFVIPNPPVVPLSEKSCLIVDASTFEKIEVGVASLAMRSTPCASTSTFEFDVMRPPPGCGMNTPKISGLVQSSNVEQLADAS